MQTITTRKRGRPPLPADQRLSGRTTARLDAQGAATLAHLVHVTGMRAADVVRTALEVLAAQTGGAR